MTARGETTIYVDGPWRHRAVSANGTRFHIAEQGEGPLVLLLHGFPEFWWTWRHQLSTLAEAGYRAVAADLFGSILVSEVQSEDAMCRSYRTSMRAEK
jgi:pimeloyl-ACP methyl ester carboxylesterase